MPRDDVRIAVLGATGMLGHKMVQVLRQTFEDTWAITRVDVRSVAPYCRVAFLLDDRLVTGVDAEDRDSIERTLTRLRPDYVVNCIGVIKQRATAQLPIPTITINSLLPHVLASLSSRWGGRVIHFSTDCVFSGDRGMYREDDVSDARDLYGRSKFLGEVEGDNALTLRTSMIGHELAHGDSLLEWFLSQDHGTVRGFTRAIYSGLTTLELARVVVRILGEHPTLSGLYHVVSSPISKHDLLALVRDAYGLDIRIEPDDSVVCDRSLRGDRFLAATGYNAPAWVDLVRWMRSDSAPYAAWRGAVEHRGA